MKNKIQVQYESLDDITHKIGKWVDGVDALLTKARLCMSMMDDGVWIGRGSDKYRAEMEGRTIPALRKLRAALSDMRYGFLRAGDIFYEAEQEGASRINHLPEMVLTFIVAPGGDQTGGFGGSNSGVGNQTGGFGGSNSGDGGQTGGSNSGGGNGGSNGGGGSNSGGGNSGFNGGGGINSNFGIPDPRIPDIFPVGSGGQTIPRPDWYTEYSDDVDEFNGALDGAVLLIDGGSSQADHMTNIVGESEAGGGVPVSGMLVPPNISDPRQAERAASAVGGFLASNPNAQIKLSPGLQALINGIDTDSQGRSLMNMPSQAQLDAMRVFVEIIKTTAEAFGRVIPGL